MSVIGEVETFFILLLPGQSWPHVLVLQMLFLTCIQSEDARDIKELLVGDEAKDITVPVFVSFMLKNESNDTGLHPLATF